MTERIRICLIGTGRAGMIHGRNFAGRIKNAELIALCDPSKESLRPHKRKWIVLTCIKTIMRRCKILRLMPW